MAQIEFFEETTKSVIANVRGSDPLAIPDVDDQVYIPHSEQAGVYGHVRVTGRQFFYGLDGCLTHDLILRVRSCGSSRLSNPG